ncbi:MAG: hypothetical protein EHM30_05595 [Desulfobacteraceae bacterium]|nr:MAG: hypothetical protein EHM30_05595 [Desulfobacteraceae bacterium]
MQKIPERKKISDEDTELINAINSGRKSLFYDLVKKYEQKLYNFGLRMCGETIRRTMDICRNMKMRGVPDRLRKRLKLMVHGPLIP